MKRVLSILPVLALALVFALPSHAQNGSARGTVLDREGNNFAGAMIVLERQEIPGRYQVPTNNSGEFFHAGLPTGTYNVSVREGEQVLATRLIRINFGAETMVEFDLRNPGGVAGFIAADADLEAQAARAAAEAERRGAEASQAAFTAGLNAYRAENFTVAVDLFQEAARTAPQPTDVIFANLALALERSSRFDESADAWRRAIELKPTDPVYYRNLGVALGSARKIDEAVAAFERAVELDPASGGTAFFNIGVLLTNLGRGADAANYFKRATDADPNHVNAHYQLAVSYFSTESTIPQAIPVLERFLVIAPNDHPEVATARALLEHAKSLQ